MPRRWLIALVLVFTGVPLGDVAVSGRKDRKFYRVFVFRCRASVATHDLGAERGGKRRE